MYRLKHVYMKL